MRSNIKTHRSGSRTECEEFGLEVKTLREAPELSWRVKIVRETYPCISFSPCYGGLGFGKGVLKLLFRDSETRAPDKWTDRMKHVPEK